MSNLFSYLRPRFNFKVGLVAVMAIFGVLAVTPLFSGFSSIFADANIECANPPTFATLNPFPITFTGEPCRDYPAISARLDNGSYPINQTEQNRGIDAQPGDEIVVRIYVHNAAAQNVDTDQRIARNIRVNSSVDLKAGSVHSISTSFRGDNTNTVNGSVSIRTGSNDRLVLIPGSGILYDYQARPIRTGLDLANSIYNLGDLEACFEFSIFLTFRVRVEGPPAPSGDIFQDGQLSPIPNTCLFNGRVTWRSQNINDAEVLVRDPENGSEQIFGRGPSGTGETPWLKPLMSYRFALWGIVGGQRIHLDEIWIAAPDLDCAEPTPTPFPTSTPTVTPTPTPHITPTPTPTPSVTLTCSPGFQQTNVNQLVTISATGGNGNYSWTTSPAGNPATGSRSSFSTRFNDFGFKTVTVFSAGQSVGCIVQVLHPATPTPTVTPTPTPIAAICLPHFQSVFVNQTVVLRGIGGNGSGSYLWSSSGIPSHSNSDTYEIRFNSPGLKTVTLVPSGFPTVICLVDVLAAPTPTPTRAPTPTPILPLTCAPSFQETNVNQNVTIIASGGSGNFSWTTSPTGIPPIGSGQSFTTRFSSNGFKTVTVTSNNHSVSCIVRVLHAPTPTPTAAPTPTPTPTPHITPTPTPPPTLSGWMPGPPPLRGLISLSTPSRLGTELT